jgi:peptidoglycan/xylan/chitin deacetylase (PgdA/CDA1 family)
MVHKFILKMTAQSRRIFYKIPLFYTSNLIMKKVYWILSILLLTAVAYLLQTMQLFPTPQGIRILMYHKVSTDKTDYLTVTTEQLKSHLQYIQDAGYQYITSQQLLDFYYKKIPLPPNPILLTFDDGYINNLELAYPILKKYKAKATICIPSNFVEKTNGWDNGDDPIMTTEQLKNLDPSVFECALHSHLHENYKNMSLSEIEKDIDLNIQFFEKNKLPFTPILAYPYGGRPSGATFEDMVKMFKNKNIKAAFRIGNSVNSFYTNDLYQLKRIDIKGTDSFEIFKNKVAKGREKLIK